MKQYLKLTICLLSIAFALPTFAQTNTENDSMLFKVQQMQNILNTLSKIKVSGYLQAQFQIADSIGISSFEGGNFATNSDKRFTIRRGRLKVQNDSKMSQYILQLDVTERGVSIKDAYIKLSEPWSKTFHLTVGAFNRPFGFEISYSSSERESPERGRMSQILFPGERDLGAMFTLQPSSSSALKFLRIDAGIFNGNGVSQDFDKKKDFISRLRFNNLLNNDAVKISFGGSYYNGGWRQNSSIINEIGTLSNGAIGFVAHFDTSNYGITTEREYIGADAQISFKWLAGTTILRGEYITGDQPGLASSTTSPSSSTPLTGAVFNRKFDGAYLYFIQDILKSKHQIVIKYDWYDPNTEIEGNLIGDAGSNLGSAEIKYESLGFGWSFQIDNSLKFMAFYQTVKNENTNLSGFTKDLKDNVLTLRLQHKF